MSDIGTWLMSEWHNAPVYVWLLVIGVFLGWFS